MDEVFKHDSGWATAGVGARNLNPGNLRCLSPDSPWESSCVASPGNGHFAKFSTLEDGIYANVDLWNRKYRGKSADAIARIWAGCPQSKAYWDALRGCHGLPALTDAQHHEYLVACGKR